MNVSAQTAKKAISWFGVILSLPAALCMLALAYMGHDLDHKQLAMLFTVAGFAVLWGGSKIR